MADADYLTQFLDYLKHERDVSPHTLRGYSRDVIDFLEFSHAPVSELVALDVEHADLLSGLVRARGKGKKERLVPIGSVAVQALRSYLEEERGRLLRPLDGEPTHALFLNRDGTRLSARSVRRV